MIDNHFQFKKGRPINDQIAELRSEIIEFIDTDDINSIRQVAKLLARYTTLSSMKSSDLDKIVETVGYESKSKEVVL